MSDESLSDTMQALRNIAAVVNAFESEEVQRRAFELLVRYVLGDHAAASAPSGTETSQEGQGQTTQRNTRNRTRKPSAKPKGPTLRHDVDLSPDGLQSLKDFVSSITQPNTHQGRQAVIIYWLTRIANFNSIDVNAVYTCYKELAWKPPVDLANSLSVTATRKRYFNTSDLSSIHLEQRGENYVEHELSG